MSIKTRWKSKSPKLFKRITNACITVGGIGVALLTLPLSLPVAITTFAGYMVTAGVVGSAISKLTVENNQDEESNHTKKFSEN